MKIKEIQELKRYVPCEFLADVVIICERIKQMEDNKKSDTIEIHSFIFDYVLSAIKVLNNINYFNNEEWINNNINVKLK